MITSLPYGDHRVQEPRTFDSAGRHITASNPDICPTEPGSEERVRPSFQHRRSDVSFATPADSSPLQEPCHGRGHARPHLRTLSTIQREAPSPGEQHSPFFSIPSNVFLSFVLSFSVSFFLRICSRECDCCGLCCDCFCASISVMGVWLR